MTITMKISSNKDIHKYFYFPIKDKIKNDLIESETYDNLDNSIDEIASIIGKEILKEKTPTLRELEQKLHETIEKKHEKKGNDKKYQELQKNKKHNTDNEFNNSKKDKDTKAYGPIITELVKRGYLKMSDKWLSNKGFVIIGEKILQEVMKELKNKDLGLHETIEIGTGSTILDSTTKYELGNDLKLINIQKTFLNTIERLVKNKRKIGIPLDISIEDFEEYETFEEVRTAVVYCIDLSSTMKYATLYGELSRIEAAKRALWTLFVLNKKFFSSDSIYIIGFGALASEIKPLDIPYLKTFQPGVDFLHYTNYQAAFRLAKKILYKDIAENKRIVLITDGHPSACFINNKEQNKILSQRPYSHFYMPDKKTLDEIKQEQNIKLDSQNGELVYLCYRYRQIDQFIGERTIAEARKCFRSGIKIDTIMISEEESLLDYINEMEKYVNGKSYYINPLSIDKMLFTDYVNNKKSIIKS